MSQDFSKIMDCAIKRCEGIIDVDDGAQENNFYQIYPFATENISGYINEFELKNKSLLTVGSSGDQPINAILYGCQDISVLDVNPYTKFYYYLKISSILNLELEEFMTFLRFKDYPNVFKDNNFVFNKELYNKVKSTLRLLNYESYLFWDELFNNFKPVDIRNRLFSLDEDRTNVISGCNPYLRDLTSYEKTRDKIKKVFPQFITGDLFKVDLMRNYDNVWLSNIGTYLSRDFIENMTDKSAKSLNQNGSLLISYLYHTTANTKYKNSWCLIYDLEKTFNILKEYNPKLISFVGVDGLKFQDSNIKDSILVYRKK